MIIFLYIHPENSRFVLSYYNTTDMDLERFIRSNFDSAHALVQGFSSEEAIQKLKQEVPQYTHVKVQLTNLSHKIGGHPMYNWMLHQQEKKRKQEDSRRTSIMQSRPTNQN